MTNFDDNYIDRYLLNQLSDSEKENFDDKLKDDKMLQVKVKTQMKIMQATKKIALFDVQMQIKEATKNWEQYVPALNTEKISTPQFGTINIEAIKEELVALINQFFRPYSVSFRNTSSNLLTTEEKAFDHYAKKEYEQAIPLLKQLPQQNMEAKLMLGNAMLVAEKFEQAYQQFNDIIEEKPIGYAAEAQWYAGLTLLKLSKPGEAMAHFQKITVDKYAEKKMKRNALKVVEQLNKIVE